jgi:hypothetical protein
MDDKITIIEGPSPTFELIPDIWVHGLVEGSLQAEVVATRLRTFNGSELVDRCYRAWEKKQTIQLEYRTPEGLSAEVPIVAARNMGTDEGDVLLLWVRFPDDSIEVGIDYGDDDDTSLSDDDVWDLDDSL